MHFLKLTTIFINNTSHDGRMDLRTRVVDAVDGETATRGSSMSYRPNPLVLRMIVIIGYQLPCRSTADLSPSGSPET